LPIPLTPAPESVKEIKLQRLREMFFFVTLYKANKWTWFFSWLFHLSLFVVVISHLRYLFLPIPAWLELVKLLSNYCSITLVIGLSGLLARRIFITRIRYISAPSDFLWLLLLLTISSTGIFMSFFDQSNAVLVHNFIFGMINFNWYQLTLKQSLISHLAGVIILLALFPFSKLLHIPGLFFSPTINQADPYK